jgi:hypothetical protein
MVPQAPKNSQPTMLIKEKVLNVEVEPMFAVIHRMRSSHHVVFHVCCVVESALICHIGVVSSIRRCRTFFESSVKRPGASERLDQGCSELSVSCR